MIFITLLIVPIILLESYLPLSILQGNDSAVAKFLDACDFTILVVFIIEYICKFYLAKNKWNYFINGWHLLNLAIIVVSSVAILPYFAVSSLANVPLGYKVIRLLRLLMIFSRTVGKQITTKEQVKTGVEIEEASVIREVDGDLKTIHDHITDEELGTYLANTNQEWLDIYNVSENELEGLSEAFGIPAPHIESKLTEEGYPRIDYLEKASLVFLQSGQIHFPERSNKYLRISKTQLFSNL